MKVGLRPRLGGAALGLLAAAVAPLAAHPLASGLLAVEIEADGRATVEWRLPVAVAARSRLEPVLPVSCAVAGEVTVDIDDGFTTTRWQTHCGPFTATDRLSVRGLERVETDILVRVRFADSPTIRAVLSARQAEISLPAEQTWIAVLRDYVTLGLGHLLTGYDHLLFLVGLLLLVLQAGRAGAARRLLGTVSAFTLGHSASLALVTLGHLRLASGPVEVAIALSLVWLANDLADVKERASPRILRRPLQTAGAFGLLHGCGFAGALAEIGLPVNEIGLALLAFNLGIEIGQLALLGLGLLALRSLGAAEWLSRPQAMRGAGYLIGSLATFWALERGAALV
ncbi:MAG: HupE/UreJ family protein [Acidobacteriota bacterium]